MRNLNQYIPRYLLLVAALAGAGAHARAGAADSNEPPAAAQPARPSVFGDKTELTLGAGWTWTARYPGAGNWQTIPTPVLSVQRGILFADSFRGAGLQYQSSSGFYISQSLFYDLGRLDRNNRWRPGSGRLAGMGDVPASSTSRTLVAQQINPWLLASAETEMALRETARRNRYRIGAELTPLKNDRDTMTVDLDAWWGDRRYNSAYFGVTPGQAARTGLPAFRPGAGLYAQAPSVSWEHRLDRHWSSTLQLSDTRYAGKVGASPVVVQRTSPGFTAAIAYTR
jgi:outer membrane protein